MPRDRCEIWAPAKINLDLTVLARRPDGYHELDTTFVAIDLYDHLVLHRSDSSATCLSLTTGSDPRITEGDFPLGEENLILKAVRVCERNTGRRLGVEISVTKTIPSAAGLGGGSSDAAATLWAINEIFGIGLSPAALGRWGMELGSDVPFFLNGSAARGHGRGEVLDPVDLYRDWWAVLLCPDYRVSTADIYEGLSLTGKVRISSFTASSEVEGFFAALRRSHNDLEDVVARRIPALASLRDGLRAEGAEYAAVSGSGPTVFGIFRDRPAESALWRLKALATDRGRLFLTQPVRTTQALKTA
jgi:4-diphosphocytidyl-2-C-methyl-D-erythritol kinase